MSKPEFSLGRVLRLEKLKSGKSYETAQVVEKVASSPADSIFAVDEPAIVEKELHHGVHRTLKPRHIQLIGIGGTIGTILFVQLGNVLHKGGPGSLFISFASWCIPVIALTNSTAEMVTYFPLPSPFIHLVGRCLDEATQIMSGYNFFVLQATLVPFEITAVTLIIHFWRSDFTPAASIVPQVAIYVLINLFLPVKWYGELEFWLAIFKVIFMLGLMLFTFITMVGGNPLHDAYGFRFWRDPGAFAEWYYKGDLGRFLGFAACFSQAAYTVSGPDYVAMTAGEAKAPRRVLPKAFRGVVVRLTVFFVFGSLCMGIVCPSNDPELIRALSNSSSTAAASPYVIAMHRLQIKVLPHIVNVAILTAAFSAGNSYFYCATRTLYGMAVSGHAPPIFKRCTRTGVPYMASLVVVAFAMLSFMQMSEGANTVLSYIVSIGTSSELINYALMNITFLRFYSACKAQGVDRDKLAYKGYWQPYCAWFSLICMSVMTFLAGWAVFLKGNWSTTSFIFSYIMIPVDIIIFVVSRIWLRCKFKRASEIDLLSGLEEIEQHEADVDYTPPKTWYDKLWRTIIGDI